MPSNDIEQALVDSLAPVVSPARVATRRHDSLPFVMIRRVGGAADNRLVDRPQVVVEAYASTETGALELLEKARSWLLGEAASVGLTQKIRQVVESAGPASLPDPLVPHAARYTMTVVLTYRRTS